MMGILRSIIKGHGGLCELFAQGVGFRLIWNEGEKARTVRVWL